MILMYHGIADGFTRGERWCVGRALPLRCFEQQLSWLKSHRQIVALRDYLKMTGHGKLAARDVVTMTFDDGLASTFQHAYPLLQKWSIPAAFFIATSHLEGHLLWFSYLNALCFEGVYDKVSVRGTSFVLSSIEHRKHARRSLGALARASGSPQAFSNEIAAAYPLPPSVTDEYKGMSYEQLSLFGKCDLLECGAHTVSHSYLDQLSKDQQAEEIFQSKHQLSELTGKPVRYFAYPNGDYNRDTLKLVKEAGYDAAFATCSKHLGTDVRFEIERMGIYSTSFLKFWLKAQGLATFACRVAN
jgi:peptidoglycan/xylan/chitin deacetylase (PgdA/CDA1 family)